MALGRYLQRTVTVYELIHLKDELIKEAENPLRTPAKELLANYVSKTDTDDFRSIFKFAILEKRERILSLLKEEYEQEDEEEDNFFDSLMQDNSTPGKQLDEIIGSSNKEAVLSIMKIKLFKTQI